MKKSPLTSSDDLECVVSFNCRVETGEKIKVVLLGVKDGKHFDFFDATDATPIDEMNILQIKAKHMKQDYYRAVNKRKGR